MSIEDDGLDDDDFVRLHELLAFIEDVKECKACDTRNMSKVIYCVAHHAALRRTVK